jgi:hypothetical protein
MSPPYTLDSGRGDEVMNFNLDTKPRKILSSRGIREQWDRFEMREKEREMRIEMQRKAKEQRDLEGCTFSPSIIKRGVDCGDNN